MQTGNSNKKFIPRPLAKFLMIVQHENAIFPTCLTMPFFTLLEENIQTVPSITFIHKKQLIGTRAVQGSRGATWEIKSFYNKIPKNPSRFVESFLEKFKKRSYRPWDLSLTNTFNKVFIKEAFKFFGFFGFWGGGGVSGEATRYGNIFVSVLLRRLSAS